MSFIHYTLVGHFDPRTVSSRSLDVARPINLDRAAALLAEYPQEIAAHVSMQNGYAHCHWAPVPSSVSEQVFEFAYRLARQEQCLAVENGRTVEYPPAAARAQAEIWEKLTGQVGLAGSRETQTRSQAEAFERRPRRA